MRKLLIVTGALLCFVVVTSSLCANENQNAAENIIRRAYTSIARIEEGKIFLKPEKLCLKQGIIYVEDIDEVGLPIPAIFSSEGYPHVQIDESFFSNSWLCDECGTWNHKWKYPTNCGFCDEPR